MPHSLEAIALPFQRTKTIRLSRKANSLEFCGLRQFRIPFAAPEARDQIRLEGKKYSIPGKFLQIQEDLLSLRGTYAPNQGVRTWRVFANIRTSYREAICFFEPARELQHAAFLKVRRKNLHANRQASLRLSARDGDSRDARQGTGNRVDVGQIHLQRVSRPFAEAKRRRRRSRRDNGIHLLKRIRKIASDQRANFLRAEIVGVVVASGQNVSAEHDSAFHFGTEPALASFLVHLAQARTQDSKAVWDSAASGWV